MATKRKTILKIPVNMEDAFVVDFNTTWYPLGNGEYMVKVALKNSEKLVDNIKKKEKETVRSGYEE